VQLAGKDYKGRLSRWGRGRPVMDAPESSEDLRQIAVKMTGDKYQEKKDDIYR
jgi:hypothetical protein